jgi:hypothetical protein
MSSDELKDFKRKIANVLLKKQLNTKVYYREWGGRVCDPCEKWEKEILRLCGYEFKELIMSKWEDDSIQFPRLIAERGEKEIWGKGKAYQDFLKGD